MSEPVKIRLEELEEWLKQKTSFITQPIQDESRKVVNNVKSRLDGIREISEKMLESSEKEMLKSNPKTYRRAKAVSKLSQNTLEILDNTDIPDEISHENLQTLHGNLGKTISAIGQERMKWFHFIEPYFIFDRRRFDMALKRAADSVGELRSFSSSKYMKIKDVEEALSTTGKIVGMLNELDELERHKKQMELERKTLEKEIDEKEMKLSQMQDQGEVSELSKVNEETEELKKQVKHNLRHLQKPFLKLQSLITSSKHSLPPNEANKLDEYLKNPFMAFVDEEEKYPLLKRTLQGMEDAMNQGKLKLKGSRLRKAQEQMKNILYRDALDSLYQNCKIAFLRREQLLTSTTISTFKMESEQVQRDLEELKKRKSLADSRGALFNEEHTKTREKIETLKKELEESILELTGKTIDIIF